MFHKTLMIHFLTNQFFVLIFLCGYWSHVYCWPIDKQFVAPFIESLLDLLSSHSHFTLLVWIYPYRGRYVVCLHMYGVDALLQQENEHVQQQQREHHAEQFYVFYHLKWKSPFIQREGFNFNSSIWCLSCKFQVTAFRKEKGFGSKRNFLLADPGKAPRARTPSPPPPPPNPAALKLMFCTFWVIWGKI